MIYGDMLSYFGELRRNFKNYELNPLLVSGKDDRKLIKSIVGILQFIKHTDVIREGETLNAVTQPTLWTTSDLKQGTYIVPEYSEEELYIVKEKLDYKFEGGYIMYVLETSIGSSDMNETNEDFNYGGGQFG